jgi:hypothetical protein
MTAFFLELATMTSARPLGSPRHVRRLAVCAVTFAASLGGFGSHGGAYGASGAPSAATVDDGPADAAESRARTIRRVHFGRARSPETRAAGFAAVRSITDPAGLLALAAELSNEADDVRAVLVSHLAASGEIGAAVLAWLAITDDDAVLRGAAAQQLDAPASNAVLAILRDALSHGTAREIDRAAELAAWIGATEVLPLLIHRLSTVITVRSGYADWGRRTIVSISTVLSAEATSYGVIGQPFLTSTGVALTSGTSPRTTRRVDRPRPAVHRAVVALARLQFGRDAPDFGYDRPAWFAWLDETASAGPPRP